MKFNGSLDRSMTVQQHRGGYVVSCGEMSGPPSRIFVSFEDAVSYVARSLGLLEIDERVVLSATTQRKESPGPELQGLASREGQGSY